MRRAALALAMIALLALAALLLRLGGRGEERPRVAEPEVVRAPEPPPAELAPGLALPAAEQRVAARTEESPVTAPVDEARAAGAPKRAAPIAPNPLVLAGTLTVVDEHGVEHPGTDGRFSFMLWSGDRAEGQEVHVEEGSWSTEIAEPAGVDALGVQDIELDGRRAVLGDGDERLPLPSDGWLAMRVRWPPRSVLSVRDAASGRELAPVLVVEPRGWEEASRAHPGDLADKARDLGASPLALPPSPRELRGRRTLFARSPGYAWGRIEIDDDRGGERILLLQPAGELEITVAGEAHEPNARLRLRGAEPALPIFESGLDERVVLVDGLAPGAYRVVAEVGDPWEEPLVLGEAAAELFAGERASVTLVLAALPPVAEVPFSGVLALPPEWELADFELVFRLLDPARGGSEERVTVQRSAMEAEGDPPARFRWSLATVQPGRYEVLLQELGFSVVIAVGAEGLDDALVEVPPPAEVRVRCLDEDTGAPAEDVSVSWRCKLPENLGYSTVDATWDAARELWTCRTPATDVMFTANGGDFGWVQEIVRVHPGANDVVLRIGKRASLTVLLRDGETEIPWDDEAKPELVPAENQAWGANSWWRDGGRITLHADEPGLYRLVVPPIPGYEPVPETTVRLEKGATLEHVVRLQRTR